MVLRKHGAQVFETLDARSDLAVKVLDQFTPLRFSGCGTSPKELDHLANGRKREAEPMEPFNQSDPLQALLVEYAIVAFGARRDFQQAFAFQFADLGGRDFEPELPKALGRLPHR